MLKSILAEFHNATHPLCVADLGATLALDSGVIEGMLQTLVQRGRLIEIADVGVCHTCPVRGGCVILNLETSKRYTLLPPTGRAITGCVVAEDDAGPMLKDRANVT